MHNDDPVLTAIFGDGTQAVRVVEHVFAVLGATYGAAWDRSLGIAPLSDTKTVWAAKLADWLGSTRAKRAVLWALRNLPEQVPNAVQFAALCRQAPQIPEPALPLPPANPERIRSELAKLRQATGLVAHAASATPTGATGGSGTNGAPGVSGTCGTPGTAGMSRASPPATERKAWARKILATPQGRTPTVLQMARDALGRLEAMRLTSPGADGNGAASEA